MKLGLNVPNFGPGHHPASLASWLRFAEDAGFDLAMMSDHVAVTPDVGVDQKILKSPATAHRG